MNYKYLLIKYLSPFLLASYLCILRAFIMIVKGDTGFGLIFIAYLLFFGLCFLVIDLVLKKLLKGSIKTMVLLEAVIVLLLLLATLYIEFKKSKREPPNFHVEPVVKKL